MITRKSLADEIDLLDADIKVLNDSKRDCFDAYRDQMIAAKIAKPNIKAEIEAVKVAIKRRREAAKDEHALIEKDELIDEVFHEITRAPRAHVEIIDDFDRETGEIIEQSCSDAGLSIVTKHTEITSSVGSPAVLSSLTTREPEESVVPHSPETATEQRVNVHSQHEGANAQATVRNECVTVVGTESGTVAHSDQPLKGGDEDPREVGVPTSNTGDGTALSALPATSGVTLEYVPPSGVKRLPFFHCFPELSKADYALLENDIAANRVREPIIRQGDVIVDGWNRYTIARKYGFAYQVEELHPGRDILLDVIELQRASRNFTPAQEKKIAADLAKEFPQRADEIITAFGLVEALEAAE